MGIFNDIKCKVKEEKSALYESNPLVLNTGIASVTRIGGYAGWRMTGHNFWKFGKEFKAKFLCGEQERIKKPFLFIMGVPYGAVTIPIAVSATIVGGVVGGATGLIIDGANLIACTGRGIAHTGRVMKSATTDCMSAKNNDCECKEEHTNDTLNPIKDNPIATCDLGGSATYSPYRDSQQTQQPAANETTPEPKPCAKNKVAFTG